MHCFAWPLKNHRVQWLPDQKPLGPTVGGAFENKKNEPSLWSSGACTASTIQVPLHCTGTLVCSALTLVSHNKLCRRAKKQRSMGRTALVLRLGWDGSSLSEHSVIITYTSTLIVIVITCFIFPLNINIWLHTRMVGHGSPSVPYEATRWLPKATDLLQIICKLMSTYFYDADHDDDDEWWWWWRWWC